MVTAKLFAIVKFSITLSILTYDQLKRKKFL